MRNITVQPFYKELYFKVAQFIFSDNRIHSIVAIENTYKDENSEDACDFAKACKNFSLPATILDKNFQILSQGETVPCFSLSNNDYDVVVSLFNLHALNDDEQICFIKQMRQAAPKAIFLEYENPERNMAYLGFLPVVAGQFLTYIYEAAVNGKKGQAFANMKKYLANGGLEGILYELPKILPDGNIAVLNRKNLGFGGIGMAYVEWN